MPGTPFKDDQIEEMLERMESGETLTSIAADPRMPCIRTIMRWEDEQDERGVMITHARARGYTVRAEKAVTNAQDCADPVKGRLAFDAERWFLGKMHPKKFGDAAMVKLADAEGNKLPEVDDVTRVTRLAALAAALQSRTDAAD